MPPEEIKRATLQTVGWHRIVRSELWRQEFVMERGAESEQREDQDGTQVTIQLWEIWMVNTGYVSGLSGEVSWEVRGEVMTPAALYRGSKDL